ncbi:hypothetical protein WN944_012660 [Citrus x changshan-huyou]|uniref:Uncharacterized protein n=1 Tax=Citrus x changshan-huyou TaxID=2935761 RepID=A0AAP0MYA0_9ROSI
MMPCYIVVHAYYDAVLHSCRLVGLRLYAMVDRDSFQTAKTHFTRSVDILTKRVRRINVTETQDWRFGLVGVGCLITVGEPVLEQSEAAALFQTENEEIDRWRLVFSSCFGLGFKGSPWIWVGTKADRTALEIHTGRKLIFS